MVILHDIYYLQTSVPVMSPAHMQLIAPAPFIQPALD